MRKFPHFISKQISRLIPEKMLFKTDTPFFLPFYHTVSNENIPYISNYPYLNLIQFEEELDYYLKYFKPVSLQFLLDNPYSKEKVFHLSFDDGLKECADLIAPVLLRKGIPATFFVNSGFADNQALFHRYKASLILNELVDKPNKRATQFLNTNELNEKNILQTDISKVDILDEAANILGIDFSGVLKTQNPYLTTEQIIKLKDSGFSIGAHSENHPEFWNISEEEQLNEIKQSVSWVVDKFNPSIKAFAFPFTDSGVSLNLLRKLKLENICDLTFGTAGVKHDECKSHFQRYPAEQHGDFKMNLKSEFVYYILKAILRKNTVRRK